MVRSYHSERLWCLLIVVALVSTAILSQNSLLSTWVINPQTTQGNHSFEIAQLRQRIESLEGTDERAARPEPYGTKQDLVALTRRVDSLQELMSRVDALEEFNQRRPLHEVSDNKGQNADATSVSKSQEYERDRHVEEVQGDSETECLSKIGDFSSRKAMIAAGWKLDISDSEFGAEFFGWKGGNGVGKLELTLKGSGRLILRVANPHPEKSKDNVVVVRLNDNIVFSAHMDDDEKVCLWFRPCDVLTITEVYGQIRLKTAKVVCSSRPQLAREKGTRCNMGTKVRWGERRCDISDGKNGTVLQVLNETRAVVQDGKGKTSIVSANELTPMDKRQVFRSPTLSESAAGLSPENHCDFFSFKRSRIGIVILADAQFQKSYALHIQSQLCYSKWRGYDHFMFDSSDFPACDRFRSVFFFQKHCIVAEFLKTRPDDYVAVVLDADCVVTTLERGVEEWLHQREDIIFYTRGKEIAAGNYIVRNTAWARSFLVKWAEFISKQPKGFSSADNGAIHLHVIETLQRKGHEKCAKMFAKLVALIDNLNPYFQFVECTRQALGPLGSWRAEGGMITVLADSKNFVVDYGVARALDQSGPVMYHGLKKPEQVTNLWKNLDSCELKSATKVQTC